MLGGKGKGKVQPPTISITEQIPKGFGLDMHLRNQLVTHILYKYL